MKALASGLMATVLLVSVGFAQQRGRKVMLPQIPPAPQQQVYYPQQQQVYYPQQQQVYYPQQQAYYPPQQQVRYSALCVASGLSGWLSNAVPVGTPCSVLDADNNQYLGVVQ